MDNQQVHSLGKRAFLLFFMRRIKFALFLVALALLGWYSERIVPEQYLSWAHNAALYVSIIAAGYLFLMWLQTYLEYKLYTYMFTEEAFIMTSGYVVRNEIAAAYHHIHSVNLKRNMLDRAMGVSQIIIFMSGSDRESNRIHYTLPGVGDKKARMVQKELLVRARKQAPLE